MKYKQMIVLPNLINNSIFNLSCIRAIEKCDNKPIYRFNQTMRSPRGVVAHSLRPGETIAQDYNGQLWWLNSKEKEDILKSSVVTP